MLPTIRCFWISCNAARMYRDWSRRTSSETSGGRHFAAPISRSFTALDHLHRVRARLALDIQHDGRLAVEAGQTADFLGGVDGFSQIA